jgi:putative transposase
VAPLREIDPTGIYHVMSRGNFRQPIHLDDGHYAKKIRLLARVAKRKRWIVLDWCLITNHHHLVIQLTEGGLSEGMRELNGCFSRWSNLQTGRTNTGHLIKNRFRSVSVTKESHFWELMRYVPINPVAHGEAKVIEHWPWGGYRATIGLEHPYPFHQPAELLRYFGANPMTAVERYRAFIYEGLVRGGHVPGSDQGFNMVRSDA